MAMSFAEYLAAAESAQKSGMSGKQFVAQQRKAATQKEASQTFNYGIKGTNTYRPPAPPKQQPAPTVVIQPQQQQQQTQAPGTTTPATTATTQNPGTTAGGDGGGDPAGGGGETTATVDPTIAMQEDFDKKLSDLRDQMAQQAKESERAYQLMISQYQTAQQQAAKDAERQRRQMQIAQAYGQQDPADVRFSRSRAQRAGMVSAGATGAFGRKGLRISGLNIPGKSATSNNQAGSFA